VCLVQTVDFFTPIVDDPYTFGAIAAANALSDVYAMGGRPISALSILAWPRKAIWMSWPKSSRAARRRSTKPIARCWAATASSDNEMKFGYAVTGLIHPDRIKTNAGARAGDALVFTKRIGTGVISTALKRGIAKESDVERPPVHAEAQPRSLRGDACVRRARLHRCDGVRI
jgi:selenide,water dikinase